MDVLMVYCDKSNSMGVFNSVHNRSKYLKKVLKMKKDVFLHGNNQIMIVPLKLIIITKSLIMNKIMRLFFMNLKSPRTYFKLSAAFVFLMSSMISTVSLFGQAPDAVLKAKTNVNCFGGNDGTIEVQVLTGDPVFRFSIYGGSPYQYSPKFINLYAGNYTVTVTDTNGLTDTVQVIILEPSKLNLSVASKSMITCKSMSDGIVVLSASGGTAVYSYKLGSGTYQSSSNFSNLAPGLSKFMVLDANSCSDSSTVTITEPALLTVSLKGGNVKCNSGNDGSITANVLGGTKPYRYRLGSSGIYKSDSIFNNLLVGTYTVQILDTNNCATSKTIVISQPTALTLSGSVTNVDCKGNSTGSVILTAGGGTSPYTYKNGTGSYQASATFSTLAAGSYTFTVLDANGCTQTVTSTVTMTPFPKT